MKISLVSKQNLRFAKLFKLKKIYQISKLDLKSMISKKNFIVLIDHIALHLKNIFLCIRFMCMFYLFGTFEASNFHRF